MNGIDAVAVIERLCEALEKARVAIAGLPQDALGVTNGRNEYGTPTFVAERDKLLIKIDTVLFEARGDR